MMTKPSCAKDWRTENTHQSYTLSRRSQNIATHAWEPIALAIEQLHSETNTSEDKFQKSITYSELAVLINIMTDGAAGGMRDLEIQARIVNRVR